MALFLSVILLQEAGAQTATKPTPALSPAPFKVTRVGDKPIITPDLDPSIGTNINGPSIIRVPKWVERPLGKYYLYFAAHNGRSIKLAYANAVSGPWKIYSAGALSLEKSYFTDHIASPDVVVDKEHKEIRLYYHGLTPTERSQHTRVAISREGLQFTAKETPVQNGSAYWKLFKEGEYWYALSMPGRLYRSKTGTDVFEPGPQLFPTSPVFIHCGLWRKGDELYVFYTRTGDTPERIVMSKMTVNEDWSTWKLGPPFHVLAPENEYEGSDLPAKTATIGAVDVRINALRDPHIFVDEGHIYLLYAVAGESGIALAEITEN